MAFSTSSNGGDVARMISAKSILAFQHLENCIIAICVNLALPSTEVIMGLTRKFSISSNKPHSFHKVSFNSKGKMNVSTSNIFTVALFLIPWIQVGPLLRRKKQLLWCSQAIHHQICLEDSTECSGHWKRSKMSFLRHWTCPRNNVTAATSLDGWILERLDRWAEASSMMFS